MKDSGKIIIIKIYMYVHIVTSNIWHKLCACERQVKICTDIDVYVYMYTCTCTCNHIHVHVHVHIW